MNGVTVEDLTKFTSLDVMNPNPNGYSWGGLILHHTGSGSEDGDYRWLSQYHKNPVSIHKLIHRNGKITLVVPLNYVSWHAGYSRLNGRDNCNSWCVGYEICNRGNGERFTDLQYEAVAQSVAYDLARFHIPDSYVSSHFRVRYAWASFYPLRAKLLRVSKFDKSDPLGWDWPRMWARVDQIRAAWPAEWKPLPVWWQPSPRALTTAP